MPKTSKSVHFRSEEQVLEAYRNRDVPAFAVWQDKQFLFKYEGDSIEQGEGYLQQWIEMISTNQSSAIYTVCVYEDIEPGTKIKDNTPYDGSFNFRLFDTPSGYLPPQQYQQYQQQGGNLKVLLDKLQAQQNEINQLKETLAAGPDSDDDDSLGIVGKILEHPILGQVAQPLLERLAGAVADLVCKPEQNNQGQTQMRKISGIAIETPDDQRIVDAIDKLKTCVDDLPALLEKLALFAEKKPMQFAIYKKMLQSMKV